MTAEMTVSWRGGRACAALVGEFDMSATFTIEPELERLVEEPVLERLVLDLSGLRFIDSTGMGVLLRAADALSARDVPLSIRPGPREVHRVFEVAGLTAALPFEGG